MRKIKYLKLAILIICLWVVNSLYAISAHDLKKIWMHKDLAYIIDKWCSKQKDPTHCMITASYISNAESTMGATSTNAFWFTDWVYKTHQKAFDRWLKSYKKYWYTAKDPWWFYAKKWEIPKTRYCMSEHSSWSKLGCPNGRKNAFIIFNKLNSLKK